MTNEEEIGAVNKLTQAQKNYLVKRINGIVAEKKHKICNLGHNGYSPYCRVNDNQIDREVYIAIIDGKVKLNSGSDIVNIIKKKIRDQNIYMRDFDFINTSSLTKFNLARNKRNKKVEGENNKRNATLDKEASVLKDKVMLEGHLATALLEKFESKEF
jgi:hypothetical protein